MARAADFQRHDELSDLLRAGGTPSCCYRPRELVRKKTQSPTLASSERREVASTVGLALADSFVEARRSLAKGDAPGWANGEAPGRTDGEAPGQAATCQFYFELGELLPPL